ncbi:MAG TPA: hypothetical protein VGG10_12760 [Rhizomicrobium sp.]|jgi:hypothetical protein
MVGIAMPLTIRDARFPRDKPAVLSFIDGLQRFEQAVEPDRRVDSTVADEFFADITPISRRRRPAALPAPSAR